VVNVSVLEGEQVTMEDTGGRETFILANESVLMRGLILRSWSSQISIRFHRDQAHNSGFVGLRYKGKQPICVAILLTLNCEYHTTKSAQVNTILEREKNLITFI
ncbi:unnamed protein product, partial [Tetraodon nigroviridis]